MSMTVEEARYVADCRVKMLQNMKAGLAAEAGIDKEKLKEVLALVRKDRSIGDATNSKAKAKAPMIPLDLNEFMKKS